MARVTITRGNDRLFESWANSEGNITTLVSAVKTVQKESNVFLSKLVEEEKSVSSGSNRKSSDVEVDEEDDEEESEDDDNKCEDQIVSTKRQKKSETVPQNAKKICTNR